MASITTGDLGSGYLTHKGDVEPTSLTFARASDAYDPDTGAEVASTDDLRSRRVCIASPVTFAQTGKEARKDSGGDSIITDYVTPLCHNSTYQFGVDGEAIGSHRIMRRLKGGDGSWHQTAYSTAFDQVFAFQYDDTVLGIIENNSLAQATITGVTAGATTSITLQAGHGLVQGDIVEIDNITWSVGSGLNGNEYLLGDFEDANEVEIRTLADEAVNTTGNTYGSGGTMDRRRNITVFRSTTNGSSFEPVMGAGVANTPRFRQSTSILPGMFSEGIDGKAVLAEYPPAELFPGPVANTETAPQVFSTADSGETWKVAVDVEDQYGPPLTANYQHLHPPTESYHAGLDVFVFAVGDQNYEVRNIFTIKIDDDNNPTITDIFTDAQHEMLPYGFLDFGHPTLIMSLTDGYEEVALIDLSAKTVDRIFTPLWGTGSIYQYMWHGWTHKGITYVGRTSNDRPSDDSQFPYLEIWATDDPTTPGWVCVARVFDDDLANTPTAGLRAFAGEHDGKMSLSGPGTGGNYHFTLETPTFQSYDGIFIEPQRKNELPANIDAGGTNYEIAWTTTATFNDDAAMTHVENATGGIDDNHPHMSFGTAKNAGSLQSASATWHRISAWATPYPSSNNNVSYSSSYFVKADNPIVYVFGASVGSAEHQRNFLVAPTAAWRRVSCGPSERRSNGIPGATIRINQATFNNFATTELLMDRYQIERSPATTFTPGTTTRQKDDLAITYAQPSAGKWTDIFWWSPFGSYFELMGATAAPHSGDLHIKTWTIGSLTLRLYLEPCTYVIAAAGSSGTTLKAPMGTFRSDMEGKWVVVYTGSGAFNSTTTFKAIITAVTDDETATVDRTVVGVTGGGTGGAVQDMWIHAPRWRLVINEGGDNDTLYVNNAFFVDQCAIGFVLQCGRDSPDNEDIRFGVWNARNGVEYSDWTSDSGTKTDWSIDGAVATTYQDSSGDLTDDEEQMPGAFTLSNLHDGYMTDEEIDEGLIPTLANEGGSSPSGGNAVYNNPRPRAGGNTVTVL